MSLREVLSEVLQQPLCLLKPVNLNYATWLAREELLDNMLLHF
jgi:hypothetical protein